MASVTLVDQIGGKELKALVATNDGAGNNIATQMATKVAGETSTDYTAPQKIVVVTSLPSTRDPNTIYLVPETLTP